MEIDALIVGQGLAGSLLGWELIRRNRRIVIIDNGDESASQVAAGLINPVTGKRLVKAEAVDTLLPTAQTLYRNLSDRFQQEFFVAKPMLRLLTTETETETARKRLQDPVYRKYLDGMTMPEQFGSAVHKPAALLQKQTGYLLTRPLLERLKAYFSRRQSYRRTTLDYRDIQIQPELRWRDLRPQRIIFCEGWHVRNNPWFSYLPLRPTKGQILTLETAGAVPQHILNFRHWLIPLGHDRFRVGATFERDIVDTLPTEAGRNQLLRALAKIDKKLAAATVVEQHAQLRPCTPDRRPFIGSHPRHPRLWIFNGFGAKGSLQIPWYSRHLADALSTGIRLQADCDIKRL